MFTYQHLAKASLGLSLVFALIQPATSQITPNGAGTLISPQGNQINITGGTQAGGNLFHSFQDFNVNAGQVANFLSNPQTQNIFGRINGGNPSFINGLLQVTGGSSNLFLMNPAGIIFGQGASLNVPASFTATTANQIGFGNSEYFLAIGENNFSALTGNPNSFLFTTNESGSIVNAGDLSVTSGQGISLIGGNVVNTGNLNAGNITLAAVPGTNRVRISQPGYLLSLEITPSADSAIAPLDLPRLLTGQSLPGISSNGSTVEVNGVGIPAGQGVSVASGNLGTFSQAGTINVLGDRVALLGANLNASGVEGGGTIRVGGEYRGGGNNPFNSRITYVDAGSFLRADALNAGDGGRVIVWGDDVTRFYGNIAARGGANGGNGGFAEVSGAQTLTFAGNADLSAPRGSFGTLLLDPVNILISNGTEDLGGCTLPTILSSCNPLGNITISQANLQALGAATNIVLEASNNITFGTLTGGSLDFFTCDAGVCGDIAFTAGGAFNTNGNNITALGRNLSITAASIATGAIDLSIATPLRDGGGLNLTATNGNITTGNIITSSSLAAGVTGMGGNINISAANGSITTGEVNSRSVVANNGTSSRAGDITITGREVNTGTILAYSRVDDGTAGDGGNVTVRATNGSFAANGVLNGIATFSGASLSGNAGIGGDITIDATNNIDIIGTSITGIFPPNLGFQTFALYSSSVSLQDGNVGKGGNIRINQNLVSNGNFNANGAIQSSSEVISGIGISGSGGSIDINAQNLVVGIGIGINSSSTSGDGGVINLTASGNISTSILRSDSDQGNGGAINLITSGNIGNAVLSSGGNLNGGSINLNAGGNIGIVVVDSISNQGNGGSIALTASGDIGPVSLSSGGNLSGGSINLTTNGNISTTNLSSTGSQGDGGSINLITTNGNITTSFLNSNSIQGAGGSINLTTTSGNITTGFLNSYSDQGDGGSINLTTTNGRIGTQNLNSYSIRQNGGDISLTAGGNILTNILRSDSDQGRSGNMFGTLANPTGANGGDISLTAGGNITTVNLNASTGLGDGGNISLNASGDISTGNLDTTTLTGNHGDITLTAGSNISTGGLRAGSDAALAVPGLFLPGVTVTVQPGSGGNINLTTSGNISTGTLTSAGILGSGDINFTTNGDIFAGILTSGSGDINFTTSGNIIAPALFSSGGNINLTTNSDIFAGLVDSSPFNIGNGGNINILSTAGNIISGTIFSQGGTGGGTGGIVDINAGNLFLAIGSSPARDNTSATISTQGIAGGGAITITHGGSTSVPFLVGNVTIPLSLVGNNITNPFLIGNNNGTVAAITSGTGSNTINNLTVPVPPDINNYGTNISIRTNAPEPPVPPIDPPIPLPEPPIFSEPIDTSIFEILTNPAPPSTPNPVIVGTPPILAIDPIPVAPTPIITTPTPTSSIAPPIVLPPPTVIIDPIEAFTPRLDRPILDANPNIQSPLSLAAANSNIPIIDRIPVDSLNNKIRLLDDPFKQEFQAFTGISDEIATLDVNQAQDILQRIIRETNTKPVFIYVFFAPENEVERTVNSARGLSSPLRVAQDTDILEVVLVPPTGDLVRVKYPGLKRPQVMEVAQRFVSLTANRSNGYIGSARQFHEWLIAPLQDELKKREINNLVFLMDVGLRSIPLAAMRDKNNEDQFIIENYSVGLMPSLTLTDTSYTSLKGSEVLGMGADNFVGETPLPGVSLELNTINQLWGGNTLFNENFTLSNLRQARRPGQRIVHLATHGVFAPGEQSNSYIQLWGNERLTLDQIRQAGWGDPPVDLLVLSACQTALGDREAELGFAGLAVQAGVKSALASLWLVSDDGTFGLMTEFYKQLQETTTKSEALRLAQLAMLRGEVRLEGGNLVTPQGTFPLNEELKKLGDRSLSHPYFWSGFTMVGNPW